MLILRQTVTVSFFFLVLASCADDAQKKKPPKTLDFGVFTIEVPHSWQKLTAHGVDSFVGKIITESSDTIGFDFGPYSNPLSERDPIVFSREDFKSHIGGDTTDIILVDNYRQRKESDQYKRQNLLWDTVDGREAKIVYPRRAGNGITGIYFDSVRTTKDGIDRLELSGENLLVENQRQLLTAIKTIKFKIVN